MSTRSAFDSRHAPDTGLSPGRNSAPLTSFALRGIPSTAHLDNAGLRAFHAARRANASNADLATLTHVTIVPSFSTFASPTRIYTRG